VLNHLIPADDPAISEADWEAAVRPHWPGPLTIARDGLAIAIEHDRAVQAGGVRDEAGDAERRVS
jgi:hypothetical protein